MANIDIYIYMQSECVFRETGARNQNSVTLRVVVFHLDVWDCGIESNWADPDAERLRCWVAVCYTECGRTPCLDLIYIYLYNYMQKL